MTALRFECVNCLTEHDEPYCDGCGADLLTDDQRRDRGDGLILATVMGERIVAAGESHSRRVPGVRSASELRQIARTQGIAAAEQVASLDAVYAALKPGKASLIEAGHVRASEVFANPLAHASRARVRPLLAAVPGIGPVRVARIVRRYNVREAARVGELTDRQLQAIAEELRGTTIRQEDPPTAAQKALTIHPKTAAGGLGGALTLLVLYALNSIWNIDPPNEIAVALGVVVTFVCSYFAPRAAPAS